MADLVDVYTDSPSQREWLRRLGFGVRPGETGLSIPLGDSWREWRLYAEAPGLTWVIRRHEPYACCELPRRPMTLGDVVTLCRELGVPLRPSA